MKTENKNGKEQHTAKASSQSLPVSTKQCMEVCRSIRYKTTTYAKKFLDEVLAHTKAVPFRYHNKDISHKPGIGAGRYPRKATEECIKLISEIQDYIGMDIHKQFTVAVAKDEQGNKLAEDKFDNGEDNFSRFLQAFQPQETKIVIESSSVWEYIYEILDGMHYEVKLANPVRTRAIAEARIKTERVDASTLADLLRANLVAESYIPPKDIRRLREITRERKTFVKQTTQMKNPMPRA